MLNLAYLSHGCHGLHRTTLKGFTISSFENEKSWFWLVDVWGKVSSFLCFPDGWQWQWPCTLPLVMECILLSYHPCLPRDTGSSVQGPGPVLVSCYHNTVRTDEWRAGVITISHDIAQSQVYRAQAGSGHSLMARNQNNPNTNHNTAVIIILAGPGHLISLWQIVHWRGTGSIITHKYTTD